MSGPPIVVSSVLRLLSATGVVVLVIGCDSEKTVTECAFGVDPSTLRCRTEPYDSGGNAAAEPDSGDPGPSVERPDAGSGEDDVRELPDVVAGEDTGPIASEVPDVVSTGLADGQCIPGHAETPMDRRIGFPCSSHGECESCYCYDEQYLSWGPGETGGRFRFCTLDCSGGTGSSCAAAGIDDYEYACVKFTSQLVSDYELEVAGVCVPRCQKAEECQAYGPQYNQCGSSWEGASIQAIGTCQITEPE